MKPRYAMLLLIAVLAFLVPERQAWGALGDYVVTVGTGTLSDMTGATPLWRGQPGTRTNNRISAPIDLGFTFRFDGTNYSQVIVYNSGILTLGTTTISSHNFNRISSVSSPAVIAPFWDEVWQNGGVGGCGEPVISHYTAGSAPNRVFIVQWKQSEAIPFMGGVWVTMEARLYEGTNVIEFYYDQMLACDECSGRGCGFTSASIGLAQSPSNFLSLSPAENWTPNASSGNDFVDINNSPIEGGTLINFAPCEVVYTGRTGPGNGGTTTLADGDVFFQGFSEQMGNITTFRPFEVMLSNIACGGEYTMTIGGAAASDYYFGEPGNLTYSSPLDGGVRDIAEITFEPTTTGVRTATLTVTGPDGSSRTFFMSITVPLVVYTGHIPEGGTPRMDPNDTLLQGKAVWRFTSQDFAPFSVTNVSLFNHTVTYTLDDPSGQYAITPDVPIGPGETVTPTITFSPTGFGAQPARLTVTVGNESRSFLLLAISAAPGGTFHLNATTMLDSNTTPFNTTYGCVGDQTNTIPVTVTNIGYNDFEIQGIEAYRTDTTYGQGVPRYPFLRDAQGELVPSSEYILTTVPPVLPVEANQTQYPILVPEGESRTIYLTFIAGLPNKRFARVYIRTNGENFFGADTTGELVQGMVNFDVFGRGVGSILSDGPNGKLPRSVRFEQTHIDESSTQMLVLMNTGACTLRVDRDELIIDRGDVDEFEIIGIPDNHIDPATNDILIPPGMRDTIMIRFSPKQIGSRRAGIRLVTNDSTIQVPGITERGSYYIDLFGSGRADLYAQGVEFGQALIGGSTSEHRRGAIRMNNTRTSPVIITGIILEGDDATEFSEDGSISWPALPFILNAGGSVDLGVVFAPAAGGQVGDRDAVVKLITIDGDTIVAPLHGIAGTRVATATPGAVNFGILTVGKRSRQTITITNTGTMPLRLEQPVMSPGSDFTFGMLPRLELAPGQFEYLEVTYAPSAVGASNGTLTIGNNGTTGPIVLNLSGAGLKTKFVDADPGRTARGENGSDPLGSNGPTTGDDGMNVSGVDDAELSNGMALRQNVPNPARDVVEIGYRLPKGAQIELGLYDGQGRLVRMLEAGDRAAGEGVVRVNVADLPNGVYHYRLTSEGRSLSRVLRIVR